MRDLKYIVTGQKIEQKQDCDFEHIVRGTNNHLRLMFWFDSVWNGTTKAIEVSNISGTKIIEPLVNGSFVLPSQVTGDSIMKVKAYGMKKTGEQIASNEILIKQE